MTGRNFFLTIPQRLVGYGRYIGYNSDYVLAVYTEKDKGRIAMSDIAKHVLVNNETIVVEYYDRKLLLGTSVYLKVQYESELTEPHRMCQMCKMLNKMNKRVYYERIADFFNQKCVNQEKFF